MNSLPQSFVAYATSPDRSEAERTTLGAVITSLTAPWEPVGAHDLRERAEIVEAGRSNTTWLSLQRFSDDKPAVSDLGFLRYFPALEQLVLSGNAVTHLTELAHCPRLEFLDIVGNSVQDLSPLVNCARLEKVALDGNPLADLSPLQSLPRLRDLVLSTDQVEALRKAGRLPEFRSLSFVGDTVESFRAFPEMPALRVIRDAHVASLDGMEAMRSLEELSNFDGTFDSLEPLAACDQLVSLGILGSRVTSLAPLAHLHQLREIFLATEAENLDLAPLRSLPLLHEVSVRCAGRDASGLASLRAGLTSWDDEFLAHATQATSSSELEIVDEATFRRFDTRARFNTRDDESETLLRLELSWLDARLESALSSVFDDSDAYLLADTWPGGRSRTVVLCGDEAIRALPEAISALQAELARCRQEWILFLQSDETEVEFSMWVHRGKIVGADSEAIIVRKLMKKGTRWKFWR